MLLRISVSCVLLFSVLFLPFWISILLALAGMIYFPYFGEAVALFLLSDLLYGTKQTGFFNISQILSLPNVFFISFLSSILFLGLLEFFKKKLKFYV